MTISNEQIVTLTRSVTPVKISDNTFTATIVTDNVVLVFDPFEGVVEEILDFDGMKIPTTISYRSKHPPKGIIPIEDIMGKVVNIAEDPEYRETHNLVGVAGRALKGTIEMSTAPDAESLTIKMREKLIGSVSAEYNIDRGATEKILPGKKGVYRGKEFVNSFKYPLLIRRKSILTGLAAVDESADPETRLRQKINDNGGNMETEMEKEKVKKDEEAAMARQKLEKEKLDKELIDNARAAAVKETLDAVTLIEGKRNVVDPAKFDMVRKKIGTPGYAIADLRTDILDNVRTTNVNIQTRDQSSERGAAISAMIRQNLNLEVTPEEAKMIRGQGQLPRTMHDVCKWDSIQNNRGLSPYADGEEILRYFVQDAHMSRSVYNFGPDSLQGLTMNVANASLKKGYDSIPTTYEQITEPESVKDFREQTILDTTSLSDLPEYIDGTKPAQLTMQDFHEVYSIASYAGTTGISRKAMINDTAFGELTNMSQMLGETVTRKKESLVYTHMTQSGLAGPVTHEDALNIFHATHKNLKTSSGVISTASFSVALQEMLNILRAAPDKTSDSQVMGLNPTILLTGTNNLVAIEQFFTSVSDMVATNSGVTNIIANKFPLNRVYSITLQTKLTTASAANAWYLFSRKPLRLLNLNGQLMPTIRSANSEVGESFGIKFDIVYDMGVYFPSWRYCHMSDGK